MHTSLIEDMLVALTLGGVSVVAAVVCGTAPAEQQPTVCGPTAPPAASAPAQPAARCHRGLESPVFDDLVHRMPGLPQSPGAVWL